MAVTIEIPAELEAELESQARRRGLSRDEFARIILEERLNLEKTYRASGLPVEPRILASNLPVKDRSREHEWLKEHRDQYAGKYVAVHGGSLIAQGDSYKEVALKARELGVPDALMIRVEPSDALPFAGF